MLEQNALLPPPFERGTLVAVIWAGAPPWMTISPNPPAERASYRQVTPPQVNSNSGNESRRVPLGAVPVIARAVQGLLVVAAVQAPRPLLQALSERVLSQPSAIDPVRLNPMEEEAHETVANPLAIVDELLSASEPVTLPL